MDQYKESYDAREREGAASSGHLPKSVILVGHSMGGFVARAAIIHPHLRKSAVETVLTLSSPHQWVSWPYVSKLDVLFSVWWGFYYFIQITSSGIAAFFGSLLCTCKSWMENGISGPENSCGTLCIWSCSFTCGCYIHFWWLSWLSGKYIFAYLLCSMVDWHLQYCLVKLKRVLYMSIFHRINILS